MTTAPKVSIFIPTYNRLRYLKVAVASALNQVYSNYVIHVFDNASTDGTSNFLSQLCERNDKVIHHRSPVNVGAHENFKRIFKEASQCSSDFFCVFSDDDLLLPGFLKSAVSMLKAHGFADFIIMDCLQLCGEYNLAAYANPTGELREYRHPPKMMLPGVPYVWTSMLFKTRLASIYLNAGMKYEIGADMRFLSIATALHPYIYLSMPSACFVNHEKSYSSSRSAIREGRAYQVVQLHRFVEVINWPEVPEAEKQNAKVRLKASYRQSLRRAFVLEGLAAVQKMWEDPNARSVQVLSDICAALRSEDEYLIERFIGLLAALKILGSMYRKILYPILCWRRDRRLSRLRLLQATRLSAEFNSIHKIVRDAAHLVQ
jgi:hypothetical protein